MNISKSGIITASCDGINENLCTWGYSMNPVLGNNAGNTILGIQSIEPGYTRYIATTVGSDGGRYGYPASNNVLVVGQQYTWSCELRTNRPYTWSGNSKRFGFEGGGMLRGNQITIGSDWTLIYNTFTMTNSHAFVFYPSGELLDGDYIDIRNLKLENGSKLTPFTIPPSETSKYVGTNHSFFENSINRPRLGSGYIQTTNIIEV